jgi:hypothetical protein
MKGADMHKYAKDPLVKNYHDRGMMKWAGFYLSEHSGRLENDDRLERFEDGYGKLRLSQHLKRQIDLAIMTEQVRTIKVIPLARVRKKPEKNWRGEVS